MAADAARVTNFYSRPYFDFLTENQLSHVVNYIISKIVETFRKQL